MVFWQPFICGQVAGHNAAIATSATGAKIDDTRTDGPDDNASIVMFDVVAAVAVAFAAWELVIVIDVLSAPVS